MVKNVKLYCLFHIDEDYEPMLIQSFIDLDEMNEWLFENEGSDYNIVIEQVNCSVNIPSKEGDLE